VADVCDCGDCGSSNKYKPRHKRKSRLV